VRQSFFQDFVFQLINEFKCQCIHVLSDVPDDTIGNPLILVTGQMFF